MMNITLEFPGFLSLRDIRSGDTLPLPHPMTVLELLRHVGIRDMHIPHIQPFVNRAPARMGRELAEGDHVFLYIPVGGG